ncbi:MAG: arylesterase [Rhodospirillales bacterium]|nr:arylesterase [Rhodospirillales bacterium]
MAAVVLLFWLSAAQAGTQPIRILAFGASIVAGYGLEAADSLPVQLEQALRARGVDATVIDAGVSGDTSAGGLARLDWALADNPDLVIVDLGGNDALRAIDPKTTEANLDAIVARLKAEKRGVLIAGMLAPPNMGADYAAAFNAVFPAVAARHDVLLYPFLLDGVVADPALNQADGIHPNAAGVKVIVERMLPFVLQAIQRLDRKAPGS